MVAAISGETAAVAAAPTHTFKGVADLLHALSTTPDIEFELTLAGTGPSFDTLRKLAQTLGITGKINMVGYCAPDQVREHYARSDIFILPTHSDAFANVILEAMSAALPVIACDVGGVAEKVIDGETGLLVAPGQPMSLAAAIRDLAFGSSSNAWHGCCTAFVRRNNDTMRIFLATVMLLSISVLASAQGSARTETLLKGDVDTGFLFAPDFKFTDVNGDFASLVGGYGGWVIDKKFLIGGGVYTLANGSGADGMTYGGGVFEYFINQGSLVNVSVRGLVGGGNATLDSGFRSFGRELGRGGFPLNIPGFGGRGNVPGFPNDLGRRFSEEFDIDDIFAAETSFFVAEPQIDVVLNISEKFRFSVGGGYRFIGGAGRLQDRLDGFTANIALKMSFF